LKGLAWLTVLAFFRTYIFTLDSLGNRHLPVFKNLRRYLKKEALDKKGVEHTSEAIGKQASVRIFLQYDDRGLTPNVFGG
jgi:hypothetical protein